MATIEKRGNLQWRARIRRHGRKPITMTFLYRAEAIAWAEKTETELREGTWKDRTEADRTTLSAAIDRYLKEISHQKKTLTGYKVQCSQAKAIQSHQIASLAVSRVGTADTSQYRDDRLKDVTASTVLAELSLLSHLFTVAQGDWGMSYLINPVKIMRKPKPNRARDRRLVEDEEQRLLEVCREYGGTLHDVILFALETAMRRGEIAELHWKDIKGNVAHLEDTKNGERRDVPLSRQAHAAVIHQVRQLHDSRVFGMKSGSIGMAFRRVCKRAGIEDLRFHDLRHEATSRLFEKGLNPMQVAAITGHKTLQMLKRYTHLRAEDLAKMLG